MSVVHRLRGAALALAVAATALVAGLVAAPPANATSCAATWGSGPTVAAAMTSRQLTAVRAGRHTCYDRLVIDLNEADRTSSGYHVSYVSNIVEDGSGQVVSLRGGAKLAVVVRAPTYDGNGRPTYTPANRWELVNVTGFQTFRQLAFAGSFEGQTAIGLGVRARLPMRAFLLAGPGTGQRLVIDVARRW